MWLPEGVTPCPSIKVDFFFFSGAGAGSALQQNNIESEGCGEDDLLALKDWTMGPPCPQPFAQPFFFPEAALWSMRPGQL